MPDLMTISYIRVIQQPIKKTEWMSRESIVKVKIDRNAVFWSYDWMGTLNPSKYNETFLRAVEMQSYGTWPSLDPSFPVNGTRINRKSHGSISIIRIYPRVHPQLHLDFGSLAGREGHIKTAVLFSNNTV